MEYFAIVRVMYTEWKDIQDKFLRNEKQISKTISMERFHLYKITR